MTSRRDVVRLLDEPDEVALEAYRRMNIKEALDVDRARRDLLGVDQDRDMG